jgi:DNA-directed RNA polymerase alpha subunit
MPKSELLKIKNFGQKSLSELYEKMGEKGCLPQEQEVSERAISSEQPVQAEPAIDPTDDSNTGV